MKYQVLDNGKPAQYPYCQVDRSWNNSIFTSFGDAQSYAERWLGDNYSSCTPTTVNIPFDYSGYGDSIEIREINDLSQN